MLILSLKKIIPHQHQLAITDGKILLLIYSINEILANFFQNGIMARSQNERAYLLRSSALQREARRHQCFEL